MRGLVALFTMLTSDLSDVSCIFGQHRALALSHSPATGASRAASTLIHPENPTLLSTDNLLSEEELCTIMRIVSEECRPNALGMTSDYQEDIFRDRAGEEEDEHFVSAVGRAAPSAEGILVEERIPAKHAESPLEQFLWVASNYPDAMVEEDIVKGANFIQRRTAREKWESEGGRQLLELSMDEEPFEKAGRRYEMPVEVRSMLMKRVVGRMLPFAADLGTDGCSVQWTIDDATIVVYGEGQSQVPHVDPCDATVLVYLHDGEILNQGPLLTSQTPLVGGDTCFPLIGHRVEFQVGKALLFFSSSPSASKEGEWKSLRFRERDVMSIHHGGRVTAGSKVVAQIMLNFDSSRDENVFNCSSWLDMVFASLDVKI